MSDFIITMLSILISFAMGLFVMGWLLRGLVGPYMKARRGGILLRVHNNDGLSARFYAAKREPSGMLSYQEGKAKRVVSPVEGSVIRCARTYMMDAPHGATAPFVWKNVVPVEEKVVVDGKEAVVTKMSLFAGYRDNSVIAQALEWALMKPKRKIPGLGLDLQTILIILGVVGVAIYFLMTSASTGGGVI